MTKEYRQPELPSDLFKVLPSMPPAGNMFTLLTDGDAMLLDPLAAIIVVSTEDVVIMVEFVICDMPGVGIIVAIGEELTS